MHTSTNGLLRSGIMLFIVLWVPMSQLSGQSSKDTTTVLRDNFWSTVWGVWRSPSIRPYSGGNVNWQLAERNEVDEASTKYERQLITDKALFTDPYVEDYLTQVLSRVVGSQPITGRPGTPHILIVKNTDPDAFVLNNGAIVLTSGMLTLIRTENELKGILAHEVAHLLLDDNLENFNFAASREAVPNPGARASLTTNRMSNRQRERVGAAYSIKQEHAADRIAKSYFATMHLDPTEYGDVLYRLGERNRVRGLSTSASLQDDHQTIATRLTTIQYSPDTTVSKSDILYDRNIAEVLTYNASLEISDHSHAEAIEQLNRAIASGWAVDDAYLLKAIALRHLSTDRNANEHALQLLNKASSINATGNRLVDVESGLIHLRLGDKQNALKAFKNYLAQLSKLDPISVHDEVVWAQKMIAKCTLPD